jgi:hypothetical protein
VLGHVSSLAVCSQASMIQSGRRRMHQSGPEQCYRARNEKPQGEIRSPKAKLPRLPARGPAILSRGPYKSGSGRVTRYVFSRRLCLLRMRLPHCDRGAGTVTGSPTKPVTSTARQRVGVPGYMVYLTKTD